MRLREKDRPGCFPFTELNSRPQKLSSSWEPNRSSGIPMAVVGCYSKRKNGVWGPVGRLDYESGTYRFCYTKGAQSLVGFRPFSQMDDMDQVYESETLFPVFANRLLSPSRPEFEAFLTWGGFDPENAPDPITVLSVTEGIRQTDSIEVFPCPIPDVNSCYLNKFWELSGRGRSRVFSLIWKRARCA